VNKRVVDALFAAVDRRDSEGVLAGYDESITIHEAASLPYGGDYRGLEGALRHGLGFRAAWDRFQPHEARALDPLIIADGDHVVVLWHHKVENPETGERLDLPAVSVYRLKNAKIADSRMFHFDTAALLRFLNRNAEQPVAQVPQDLR
jgi:ketosteroid isomerase-like protein